MKEIFLKVILGVLVTFLVAFVGTNLVMVRAMQGAMAADPLVSLRPLVPLLERSFAEQAPRGGLPTCQLAPRPAAATPDPFLCPLASVPSPLRAELLARGTACDVDPGGGICLALTEDRSRAIGIRLAGTRPAPELGLLALVLALVLICVLSTGYLIAAPLVRDLRKLERAAASIQTGDLSVSVEVTERSVVSRLASTFNDMTSRLATTLEDQRQLLQAVSHELRTPVARIRFGVDMLGAEADSTKRERRLASLDEDLTEIDDLIRELLLFNRLEQPITTPFRPTVLQPLLDQLAADCEDLHSDLALTVDGDASLMASVDIRLFERAIRNVVQNGCRYATSRVRIGFFREGAQVAVEVSDDGPGIPASAREQVLKPFTCLDESRDKRSGGYGLGLAIVSRIVKAHRGRLAITESDGGGARVTTWWPAAPTSQDQEDAPRVPGAGTERSLES